MFKAPNYFERLLLVIFTGIGLTAQAQQVDLNEVLQQATENYPAIKARQENLEGMKREKSAVASGYIPRLSVQHQYTFSTGNSVEGSFYPNGVTISPSGGVREDNVNEGAFGSFTSALLEWNVYTFGKQAASNHSANAAVAQSQAALDNEIFQHQVKTTDAYLMLLIAEKLTQIQQRNLERASSFSEAVDANVLNGLRPGVDSSLAHAEYAKAKILLLDSKRNENARRYQLMEMLGKNPETNLIAIDSMHFFSRLPGRNDLNEVPLNENPLLKLQLAKIATTHQQSILARRSFLPDLTLVAAAWARGSGVSNSDQQYHTDFASGTEYQVQNYLLGVALKWTPTDFFASRNRYKKYENLVQQETELYNQQQLSLNRQLRESEMQYEVMIEQAQTAPIQLSAAQQAYRQAAARYKNGLTDLPTMLQAVVALNRAEADVAITYSNVWRSLLMMAAAKGDLTKFTETFK